MRNKADIAQNAVDSNPKAYFYISEELRKDKRIVKAALSKEPSVISSVPFELRSNKELMKLVFGKPGSGQYYDYIQNEARKDKEIIKLAVLNGYYNYM